MQERMSLIVFSGTVDKLMAASILATGGDAMGLEVEVFLTTWGLEAFRKDGYKTNVKVSKDFEEYGPVMMEQMMAKKAPSWMENFKNAMEVGDVKIYGCSKTELQYLFPLPRVFPIESVAEAVTPLLEERHIGYTVFFNTERVDTQKKVITSLEGEEIPYDLLVLVPPHRGARVIEDAGLGDEQGWIPTDRHTLEVKEKPRVYALGDATDLPVSKSGSAAHFEAKIVAARILAAIRGEEPKPDEATYDGEVMCFLETGYNKATQLVFNYEHPPRPPRPSLYYHMEKQLFNRAYWHIVPQGLV